MRTRFNKTTTAETIDRIIASTTIPTRRKALLDEAKTALIAGIKANYPKGFQEALDMHPKEWFKSVNQLYCRGAGVITRFPVEWCGEGGYMVFDDPIYIPDNCSVLDPSEVDAILEPIIIRAKALAKEEAELRTELQNLIAGYSTVEAMAEAVPELAQHLPPCASKTTALSVLPSNALAALQRAGMQLVSTA